MTRFETNVAVAQAVRRPILYGWTMIGEKVPDSVFVPFPDGGKWLRLKGTPPLYDPMGDEAQAYRELEAYCKCTNSVWLTEFSNVGEGGIEGFSVRRRVGERNVTSYAKYVYYPGVIYPSVDGLEPPLSPLTDVICEVILEAHRNEACNVER